MSRRRMSSSSPPPSSCSLLDLPILSTLAFLIISLALLSATTPTTSAVFAFALSEADQLLDADGAAANASEFNSSSNGPHSRPKEDSFADMIDRALEKEFNETDQNEANDAGSFNNTVSEQQAVLETVARVKSKKNDTKKEEKSFQLHHVFNLDNDNGAEETPTLIDRKDNVFIISSFKSKYPVLQLDLRLISDLVVVIVVSEIVQVETVAQFGVMEKNSTNTLHGQVTIGTLILQDCAVGLLFALLPVLGGTSGVLQGVMSMTKSSVMLFTFLAVLSILSRTCVPWFLKLMVSLSSQTNELYQLAAVAFCLLVAWCSDKLGLSLELGSFAAGVMISTTDLAQHTLEQVEPIRNFFAALFLASIGMLIHVHFLWNHVDILLASVILVIVVKTAVIFTVVKGFGYNNKTAILVGMSLAQIGEFAFVLLSRASNLHLVEGKLYLLLLGTTALSLVTTPLLFKLIPAVVHLGVLLRWFSPDSQTELGLKGETLRSESVKQRIALISKDLLIHEG
ncbi:PREDICTED: K(+) efflux antiporter 4-like isoform X4 [Ipomoea nil]|uniref:K(+) efflux antiporter 4-like isoform X4 n=1 Tax=Ipomoea nil TaxID=35883 RepID=UPI0009009999|nr:PREDICTED: K(+) efflux antiporter 4-like isoform X4 [Ipomoea nil]